MAAVSWCGGAFAAEPRLIGISDNGTGGVRNYIDAVEAAGHVPIVIGLTTDTNRLTKAVAKVDALLLTGGEDVAPARYGAVRSAHCGTVNERRDAYDFALVAAARERRIPIAGICRGMQLINVAFGGTLYQDLPTAFCPTTGVAQCSHRWGGRTPAHAVSIDDSSRLAATVGTAPLAVNSRHHQAVKDVAPGFRVTATAPDGVIEAFESDGYPAIGVQFHPEKIVASGADDGFDRRRLMALMRLLCEQGQ